jgi:hypothetical protein
VRPGKRERPPAYAVVRFVAFLLITVAVTTGSPECKKPNMLLSFVTTGRNVRNMLGEMNNRKIIRRLVDNSMIPIYAEIETVQFWVSDGTDDS